MRQSLRPNLWPRVLERRLPRFPSRWQWLLIGILALLAFVPDRVSAHAGFERSEPAEDSVVAESPERVNMWFGQEMARLGGLPTVIVVNAAGDVIADEPILDDNDRTHIYIELPPDLPPQRYTVIWHNLSDEDGEEAQGAFHFYVGSGPGPTEAGDATIAPTASSTPAGTSGGNKTGGDDGAPWWLIAVAAIGGVAVGAGGGVLAVRSGSHQEGAP